MVFAVSLHSGFQILRNCSTIVLMMSLAAVSFGKA